MGWPRLFPSLPPPRPGFALSVHVGSSLHINLFCVYPHARENAPSPDKTPLYPCGCVPSTHSHTRAQIKPRTTTNIRVQNGESLATNIKATEASLFLFKSATHARSSPQKTFCQQKFKVSRQARARFVWFGAASSEYPCFFPR